MKFRSESRLSHPRDAVFLAYRDKLPEVVTFLDDIKAVNVLARADDGGVTRLHNEWVSDREIPKVAAAILKPEHLRWDDHATWDAAAKRCVFEIHTRVFTDNVRCTGSNTFLEDGAGTKVVLEGDFQIDLKGIPGVPRFLAGTIAPQVEAFIIQLIQPNLEKVNLALGKFLDARGASVSELGSGARSVSVTAQGEPDGWVPPRGFARDVGRQGETQVVVSVEPEGLQRVHLALVAALEGPLSVLYRQLVHRAQPAPQGSPPRDFVALGLPRDRVLRALTDAASLVYHDARSELWIRGRLGDQVVLDADGVIYCQPDDPLFEDVLRAEGVPEGIEQTVLDRDYVRHNFHAANDAVEVALWEALGLVEVAHRR